MFQSFDEKIFWGLWCLDHDVDLGAFGLIDLEATTAGLEPAASLLVQSSCELELHFDSKALFPTELRRDIENLEFFDDLKILCADLECPLIESCPRDVLYPFFLSQSLGCMVRIK